MRKRVIIIPLVVILAVLIGGSLYGKKPGGDPPPPCDGSPIEVFNTDLCGATKWIAVTDSATVCQILCATGSSRPGRGKPPDCGIFISWIGGIVIADPGAEHGFNFDPSTVIVAEVTAEGMQTSTCLIANNPGFFDGGRWYIPAGLGETRPY